MDSRSTDVEFQSPRAMRFSSSSRSWYWPVVRALIAVSLFLSALLKLLSESKQHRSAAHAAAEEGILQIMSTAAAGIEISLAVAVLLVPLRAAGMSVAVWAISLAAFRASLFFLRVDMNCSCLGAMEGGAIAPWLLIIFWLAFSRMAWLRGGSQFRGTSGVSGADWRVYLSQ